ncbi:MAG: N-acetyltransferase [Thermoleophilia bacterium]|nr:N-acetyltransferase [Thermoleophilia bacterium]
MVLEVGDNPARERYELRLGERVVGSLDYRTEPGALLLVHAEIEPASRGHGLGSRLVAGALDDVRARGLTVVPRCSFVASFVARNPEYADLVARHAGGH